MKNANKTVKVNKKFEIFVIKMDSSKSFSRQTSFGSDQVILYHEALSPRSDFGQLEKLLTNLDEKEKESLKDLKKYLLQKEGAWLLDLQMLGKEVSLKVIIFLTGHDIQNRFLQF